MNFLKRAIWTTVAVAAVAGGASAQTIGGLGGSGTTGGAGGATGGGGIGGGTGGGGMGGGGTGTGGGGSSSGTGTSSTGTNSGVSSVTIKAPSEVSQAPSSVSPANAVGKYLANPYYQGLPSRNTSSATTPTVVNPGGFGTPLYGTNLGVATGTGGAGGRGGGTGGTSGFGTTGFGNSTGGVGGGGFGAGGGANSRTGMTGASGQGAQGVVAQGATSIAYTASVKFSVNPISPAQFQADMQAVLNRTTGLSNAAGIQVTTGANGAVTLRGQVRDEDEARLVGNLLASTPGVRSVDNGLTFPRQ